MPELFLDASRIHGPDACRSILLVGEDNPLHVDPHFALYHEPRGCAGNRLQSKIMGLSPRRHYLPMWRTNLCVGGWDRRMAADRAALLIGRPAPWSIVITLGMKVSEAFSRAIQRVELCDPFVEVPVTGVALAIAAGTRDGVPRDTTFVSLPHPSGRNTTWNNAERVTQAREILRRVAPLVPWGELDNEQ